MFNKIMDRDATPYSQSRERKKFLSLLDGEECDCRPSALCADNTIEDPPTLQHNKKGISV